MMILSCSRASAVTTRRSRSPFALALVIVALLTTPVSAQESLRPMSASEFLAAVEGRLYELERIDAEIDAERADVEEARALAPLELSYEREEVVSEGLRIVQKEAVGLGWSVDVSGARGLAIESAKLDVRAQRLRGDYQKHLARLDALEVYYRAAHGRLRAESLRRTASAVEVLVGKVQSQVGEGDASGYDLTRFEMALADHQDELAEAEAQALRSALHLRALVGFAAEASDDLALPAEAKRGDDAGTRADLLATEAEGVSARKRLAAARRWWVPTLDVFAGYMSADLGPGDGPGSGLARGYTAMLTASLPIFSRNRAGRDRARADARLAKANREILSRDIAVARDSARILVRSRLERARAYGARQLVRAERFVSQTDAAYREGEADAGDLLEAHQRWVEVALRFIDLRYQYHLAELEWRRAAGQQETEP